MFLLNWLGFGIMVLVILGATGLLMGAVCRSVMHVDDGCEPTGHGRKETKAVYGFSQSIVNSKPDYSIDSTL